jgi:cytoskeleton protein RodZ
MNSIGNELRTERLRRGLTLERVAAETKIDLCYLEAMEDNRFDDLNLGSFFRRSFLRQYARILEIDENHLLSCLKEQFETLGDSLPPPKPRSPLRVPPMIPHLLLAIAALASFYMFDQNRRRLDNPPALSKPKSAVLPPKVLSDHSGVASRAAESDVQPQQANPALVHVSITATEPVWLSVSSDGITAYKGTMETQQIKTFDSSAKLTVLAGNAEGLAVALNGKPVGRVGSRGEVVLLEFTPGGLRIARPVRKPVEDPSPSETPESAEPL